MNHKGHTSLKFEMSVINHTGCIAPRDAAAVAHLGERRHAASEEPAAAPRGRAGVPFNSTVLARPLFLLLRMARLQRGRSRPRPPPVEAAAAGQ